VPNPTRPIRNFHMRWYAGVLNDDEYEYDVADAFLEDLGEVITRALSDEHTRFSATRPFVRR
jgi:hypothetical protein